MNDERGLGAMPKLYGAPAYSRPLAVPVSPVDRPDDPDDLPLEAERELDDLEPAGQLEPRPSEAVATVEPEDLEPAGQLEPRPSEAVATVEPLPPSHGASTKLHGRPFRLRIRGRSTNGR